MEVCDNKTITYLSLFRRNSHNDRHCLRNVLRSLWFFLIVWFLVRYFQVLVFNVKCFKIKWSKWRRLKHQSQKVFELNNFLSGSCIWVKCVFFSSKCSTVNLNVKVHSQLVETDVWMNQGKCDVYCISSENI